MSYRATRDAMTAAPGPGRKTAAYVSVVASSLLVFMCLIFAIHFADFARNYVAHYRKDLGLYPSTAFLFHHVPQIWKVAYGSLVVVLITGITTVHLAPDPKQAKSRALLLATLVSVFSIISMCAAFYCIFRSFLAGVIIASPDAP